MLYCRFIGVSDLAAVRFSLPAQLLEPTPNLGMSLASLLPMRLNGSLAVHTNNGLTQFRILALSGQTRGFHKVSMHPPILWKTSPLTGVASATRMSLSDACSGRCGFGSLRIWYARRECCLDSGTD